MKFDLRSVRFRMWAYFMGFAAVILVMLWLLQIVFIKNYYEAMKTNQITQVANSIVARYGQEDFKDTVRKYTFKNNMFVNIMDMQGKNVFATSLFGDSGPAADTRPWTETDFDTLKNKLLTSGSGRVTFHAGQPGSGRQMLVYGAILGSGDNREILNIVSPIDPIDSTEGILKNQLVMVTILVLLTAVALSIIFSRKLARPINRITVAAGELAQGNYDVKFEKGFYTEVDKLASTLNFATSELSKTDELRRDLIANVSHDLRTPLTMVKAYAEMIRDISGPDPVKRGAHLSVIIDEADRLSGLVSDMLDLSKIQSGMAQLYPERFNLSETVGEITRRFRFLTEREGYVFTLRCEENVPVCADEMRIEQVIYNLIGNAVNYTGGDKQVEIRLTRSGTKARFEVTDTGEGIPPERLDTIWERYYRDEETHRRAVIGTGLGLSIVKSILCAHKADFGVKSEEGRGSTFWFELEIAESIRK